MMSQESTILVVDDNPENIDILVSLLTRYDVIVALDGNTALKILNEETVDLILLDVMMPGMNGFEVCKNIKSTPGLKGIPVIFLTAKAATEDIVRGFDVGGVDYVIKPFRTEELLARIKTHIELKNAREEIRSLRSILPICSYCKKIRDDNGYWNQLEAYIQKHSMVDFSHGICPKCAKEHYPDIDISDDRP
jgi:DNA-binding response OmpR family regulator